MNFKSPSENGPLVPAILYLVYWSILNSWIYFLPNAHGLAKFLGQSFVVGLILFLFGGFILVILLSYLFTKKFVNFGLSLVLLLCVQFATGVVDRHLAPSKAENLISKIFDGAAIGPGVTRPYGNISPIQTCKDALPDGNRNCRACFCPNNMDIGETNGHVECLFRNDSGEQAGEKFSAPCSPNRIVPLRDAQRVVDLFANDAVKSFAVYTYLDNKLDSCREYKVWSDWDTSVMKKVCEHGTAYRCLVQDRKPCSTLGASTVCARKDKNTYRAVVMAAFTSSFNTSGFTDDECQSGGMPRVVKDAAAASSVPEKPKSSSQQPPEPTPNEARRDQATARLMEGSLAPVREASGPIIGYKINAVKANGFFTNAGLKQGDVLKKVDGTPVTSTTTVLVFLEGKPPGSITNLEIERGGQLKQLVVQW